MGLGDKSGTGQAQAAAGFPAMKRLRGKGLKDSPEVFRWNPFSLVQDFQAKGFTRPVSRNGHGSAGL
jgi:hypothetical protein